MTTTPLQRAAQDQGTDGPTRADDELEPLRRKLEGLLGIPATEDNSVQVLKNGDQIFPEMLAAIRGAERSVDLLTFVYWQGDVAAEFAHALAERARHDVRVRVLLDAVGGRLIQRDLIDHMLRCGVQVEWYRKPWAISPMKQNHRTHRKVLVVDERVGFTGGVGIAQEWCGDARDESEWRDTHFRFEGPVVDGLRAAFAQNWAETGHPLSEAGVDRFPAHDRSGSTVALVARGSATVGWNDMSTLFHVAAESAKEHLRIATAYFAPSPTVEALLLDTAKRGVRVDILLPGPHADKRACQLASESTYERLVDGGVNIWAFQPSMMHAKITLVDDLAAVVGSANLNYRSHHHDEEVSVALLDRGLVATLTKHFEDDLARSERIDPERWADRPPSQKVLESSTTILKRWF